MRLKDALGYARNELNHGNARSRSIFVLRAITWPARRVWRALIGAPEAHAPHHRESNAPRLQVAVLTGGGLGDLLSTSGFVERLFVEHGRPDIDVFYAHRGYLEFVFARARYVRHLLPESAFGGLRLNYDVVIHVHRTVAYEIANPARVAALAKPLLWIRAESTRHNIPEFEPHMRDMPYLDGDLAKRAVLKGFDRKALLGYSGAVGFKRDDWVYLCPDITSLEVFERWGLSPFQYITIHDGFDTNYRMSSPRSTKQWPFDSWQRLIRTLRARYPEMKLVQLGGVHSQPFDGVDVQLIGKTDFNEAAWLLKFAACHVDNESGIVRLCREMGGRSVVVFGPTDPDFFGHTENINVRPHKCGNCFWSTRDWLNRCPRGLAVPECTASITVEEVAEAVGTQIRHRRPARLSMSDACLFEARSLQQEDDTLQDIFQRTGIPSVPISQHTKSPDNTIYLDASKQWEYLYVVRMLAKHMGQGAGIKDLRVADLGGGRGALSSYLASLGACTSVFDIDFLWNHGGDLAVEERFFEAGKKSGFSVRYGSIFNIPAPDESFDVVTCVSVIEHVPMKEFAFREALRVLKPNGIFILTFDIAIDTVRLESGLRVEIFSPQRIDALLKSLGVAHDSETFRSSEVAASVAAVQSEHVLGLPPGLTVGGLVIVKNCEQHPQTALQQTADAGARA